MSLFICPNKCCKLKINPYSNACEEDDHSVHNRSIGKAGVVLHDTTQNKILIVQSRGHLWGPPKGTLKYGESHRICAVREVKEETGLVINSELFTKAVNLPNRVVYFYMHKEEVEVFVQDQIPGNDANGIGWINIECLRQCIKNGNISLSRHCQIVLDRLLGETFAHPVFTQVKPRRMRKKGN